MNAQKKKLTLVSLVLMIFTSVFGFNNIPRSFYLMGYSAIPWYMLSALTFFIPFAFILAEYGAAFKNEKGGIYSWMEISVSPKYAFVGTFMWYASFLILLVNISTAIWIPLSNLIYGYDATQNWSILGLTSTQSIGLLGIIWVIFVTFIASRGLGNISKITTIGGIAVALLNVILFIGAITVLILNHGKLAEPINSMQAFVHSPNSAYQSPLSLLSFLVFAIFAYGGIEIVGGLVDETENGAVTFPKGVIIAAIVISLGYSIGIFLCGMFINFNEVLSSDKVHIGNVAYVVMQNLGYELGHSFNLTEATCLMMGTSVARFVGLSMFLAMTGAFFALTYSPLKQLIEGTPAELWPGNLGEVKNGVPVKALKIQCVAIVIMLLLVSFGGEGASKFFSKLVLMTNVAITLPNLFLVGAYIPFKTKENIKKPFEMFKSKFSIIMATSLVMLTVGFANFFTIIEPLTKGNISSTLWMIGGPVFFSIVALIIYGNYEKKIKSLSVK